MAVPHRIMGLDLGTTKVTAVIAEVDPDGLASISGVGTKKCEGLRKGVIVDIDKTVRAVEGAVTEAEIMAGYSLNSAYVSISGDHVKGMNSTGVVAVSKPDKEITDDDVDRVVAASRGVVVPNDRLILHVIPQEFLVDDQDGISHPVGMSGIRLEVKTHIITGSATCAQNVIKSVRRAGIDIEELVLQSLATGFSLVSDEESNLGVAVVDIGGGTTDIAVFKDGALHHTAILGLGGHNITNDLAVGLRTPLAQAEILKIRDGCAKSAGIAEDETLDIPGVHGRKARHLSKKVFAQIMESRIDELLYLVRKQLVKSDYYEVLGAGVILTGGTALIDGILDSSEEVISMPTRLGLPEGVGGLQDYVDDPRMATSVGLIRYAADAIAKGGVTRSVKDAKFGDIVGKVRRWVNTFF
ncbi:MAG: cell division protein FtsA [bacterium]